MSCTKMSITKKQKSNTFMRVQIMKIMCIPGYHHNSFVATHKLGHS